MLEEAFGVACGYGWSLQLNTSDVPLSPAAEEPGMMACFAPGRQLGAVGMAFMEAAAEMSEGIIDADTGEKMEQYLNNKELLQHGELNWRCLHVLHASTMCTPASECSDLECNV